MNELLETRVSIFANVYSQTPHEASIGTLLNRIKDGRSKTKVTEIQATIDKGKRDAMKLSLPCVCFSGLFSARGEENIAEHSGFIVLDIDDVFDIDDAKAEICAKPYTFACWTSPSGSGVKVLVRVLDKDKHREHFASLRNEYPDVDKSGSDPSRLCFESYDPDIYINTEAMVYDKVIVEQYHTSINSETVEDAEKIFRNILSWLANSNHAFEQGERNLFVFKLACACCRYGISQDETLNFISREFGFSSTFSRNEAETTVRSAYKKNSSLYGSASFSKDILVDTSTRKEIVLDSDFYDKHVRPKDVIYGEDVQDKASGIYDRGHESISGIGVEQFDYHFKMKRQELTLLTGIGGHGKSTLLFWMLLMRAKKYGEKVAIFSPEVNPPEEFYWDLVEILLGTDCTPANPNRPSKKQFDEAYDFVSKHFFYIYPEKLSPTPEYIKTRFLELIIKEKVDTCIIDPVNMLSNDYSKFNGRDDRFLETFLSDLIRFSQQNNVYMILVAHPTKLQLNQDTGEFDAPNVFNISGGSMWNNKAYNILCYHRPNKIKMPEDPTVEFHALKIRKQKIVGKPGVMEFSYDWKKRRFVFGANIDPLQQLLDSQNTSIAPAVDSGAEVFDALQPSTEFDNDLDF